ncbi:oxidation resistance protein 1-like isoform X1 [Mytilus edulis]
MATEKQSFKDRTIKKLLGNRFTKSSHSDENLPVNPNNAGKSSTTWYVHDGESEIEPLIDTAEKGSLSNKIKKTTKTVPGKISSNWFLQDESNLQADTSKKESPPDQSYAPVKLERAGSVGSKKKVQPDGTFVYDVKATDTLSSIAAHYDVTPSELKKLNKLTSQYIFPQQVLYIPSEERKKKAEKKKEVEMVVGSPPKDDRPRMDIPIVKMADKPPSRVPGHAQRQTPVTSPKDDAEFVIPHVLDEDEIQQLDQDCYERFIKVNCKHITDGQGVVSGVLLVTPNAVMFDPNVSDPLVIEHGADTYGVIAPMDMIISCAMYHDIVAMNRKKNKDESEDTPKPEVYHDRTCAHYQSWVRGHSVTTFKIGSKVIQEKSSPSGTSEHSETTSICSCGVADQKLSPQKSPSSNRVLTQSYSPVSSNFEIISQSSFGGETTKEHESSDVRKTLFDNEASENENTLVEEKTNDKGIVDLIDLSVPENKTEKFYLEDNENDLTNQNSDKNDNKDVIIENQLVSENNSGSDDKNGNQSPGEMRIGNIVYMPVSENSKGEVSEKDIQDVKSTLSRLSMTDFESRDRTSSAPVDVPIVSMTSRKEKESSSQPKSLGSFSGSLTSISPHINTFVNYATGLFKPDSRADIKDVSEIPKENPRNSEVRKETPRNFSSSGTNLSINMTEQDFAVAVESAVKLADKPELFQSFDKLIPKPAVSYEDPPLYLCIRLGKPIRGEISQTCPIAAYSKQKKKPEYWFSIPREKVDPLYAFFVQWKPEIYGDDDDMMAEKRGFVVLSEDAEESGDIEILDEYFGGGSLQKDWEFIADKKIISAEEMMKRKSIDTDDIILMPELLAKSNILEDFHLEMLNSVMPPRTVGYPWSLIYSTEKHGFSLKTMYRHMHDIDTPILLVVKDTAENVFGAMTSCEMKVSDHFYGTGESFLYSFYPEFKVFRWTGENNFFMKGNQESLSIGAGQGQFGLWFDGDIYHGRTNRCETYDNDILTISEDFVVSCFEAWGFTD